MTTARFISPFMTNGNIEEYLAKAPGPVTDALRLDLLKGSLSGLAYLHSLDPPVCHADIKPENVLVTDSIEAVLCDFGLARLADAQPSGLTTSRTIRGSTRYMSPELLEDDAFHTLSSDVWAYGCLLFKVMTGSLPYASARSDQQLLLALAFKKTPMELADLDLGDDQLTTLLTKCWDINPSTRPSAAECLLYLPNTETKTLQFPETVDDSISAFTHDANYRKRTTSTAATIRQSSTDWSADPTIVRRFAQDREANSTPLGRSKLVLSGHPTVGPPSGAEEQAGLVEALQEQAGLVEALLAATSRAPRPPQTRVPQDPTPTPRPAVPIATSNDTSIATVSLSIPSSTASPRHDEDASATSEASDSAPGSLAAVRAANRDLAALIISLGYASEKRTNSRRPGSVEREFNLSVILDDDSQDEQL